MNVGIGVVKLLLGLVRGNQGPAVTGADRIDEDQVGKIQPRSGIVEQLHRIRRTVALVAELQVLRPNGAQDSDRRKPNPGRRSARR